MQKKVYELLLVEDDCADVDLIKESLDHPADRPYEIHLNWIDNGEEAIAFLKKGGTFENAPNPDLIILDLNMPGKSGLEVLKEIKSDENLKLIPVVVLTTSNSAEDVDRSYKLGANSFITKARDFSIFSLTLKTVEDYWLKFATLPSPSFPNPAQPDRN